MKRRAYLVGSLVNRHGEYAGHESANRLPKRGFPRGGWRKGLAFGSALR
jgi:hypothetical protein